MTAPEPVRLTDPLGALRRLADDGYWITRLYGPTCETCHAQGSAMSVAMGPVLLDVEEALAARVAAAKAEALEEAAAEVFRELKRCGDRETRRRSYTQGAAWRYAANRAEAVVRRLIRSARAEEVGHV